MEEVFYLDNSDIDTIKKQGLKLIGPNNTIILRYAQPGFKPKENIE